MLYSSDSLLFGGNGQLSLEVKSLIFRHFMRSSSNLLGNLQTDARHLRISTVGIRDHEFEIVLMVSPFVSMGLREDGKRSESFLGVELGGGIGFANPCGYEISTKGEVLFAGTDQVQERGMSGKSNYDSAGDGLGIQLNVAPEWGGSMLVADYALWGDSVQVQDFDSSMHTSGSRINAENGYGLNVWEALGFLKPYCCILLSDSQEDEYRMGTRFRLGSKIEFELEGSRALGNSRANEDEFKLDGMKWVVPLIQSTTDRNH